VFMINFAEDPPDAKTGAPGEGTCADCHGGDFYEGSIEISGFPSSVLVNQTYSITVTIFNTDLAASQAGFQMVALNSANENAGSFIPNSADEGIDSTAGRQYIENRNVKTFGSGEAFWTFDWTAPAGPQDDTITMYAAGAITNGDNKESGDDTKLTSISATLLTGGSELAAFISDKADVSCNGLNDGFATVSASGGKPPYTYKWSNGDDDATTTLLSAGNYSVTVSDSDTMVAVAMVDITQPLPLGLNVISIQNVLCFGERTGSANISGTGGVVPYSYLWPDGFEGNSRSDLAGGSYVVTVTDFNGCADSGTVTITQPDSIVLTLTSTGETGQNTDDGSATVMVMGGTPNFTYRWSNGVTTQTIANL
ncbi:MAG: SprB repeat-containing protein, partial [Saprospiraceae bacterium]|nr:SprB repeat-containing protein [Saprospiraceae bacterium]